MTTTIVRLEDIYKIYGSGETEVRALAGVNLTIEEVERVLERWKLEGPHGG